MDKRGRGDAVTALGRYMRTMRQWIAEVQDAPVRGPGLLRPHSR
jgi:hypothetical protein